MRAEWRAKLRRPAAWLVEGAGVALALTALAGCSGSAHDQVAVRVGDVSISAASVDHWAKAVRLGSTVGASPGKSPGTPRERALSFLIEANWLIGEAAEEELEISDAAVDRALKQRRESLPGGPSEFEEELDSTGQTTDDVKLEIEAELAVRVLHHLVETRVPVVAEQQEVLDYYHRNIARFRVPERRRADLIESIDTRAEAVALGRRLGSGARFAKRALHELVARQTPAQAARANNAELVHAIFAATPGEVAAPARFNGQWVLIVVRGRVPARTKGLKEVEDEVETHLLAGRRRQLFAEFAKGLRDKWTERTDCRPGFVVQKCPQYRGPLKPEEDPLSSG